MNKHILKLEPLAIFLASLYGFSLTDYSWLFFFATWLIPDIFMVGYAASNKFGALSYNAAHNYILPLLLLCVGYTIKNDTILALSIIWISHVSLDRFLGYGLKTEKGFKHTHLGIIGKK